MNYIYTFFIGADNVTGEVNKSEVLKYFNKFTTGYTLIDTLGYWNGKQENSIKVEIIGDTNACYQMQLHKKTLENILQQESIILTGTLIELI